MRIKLSRNTRSIARVLLISASVGLMIPLQAQDGEELFKQCMACHSIGQGKRLGPDLLDISKKRDRVWLKDFIKSSQTMIKNGDPDAVALFEEFNKLVMIDYPLPDADIEAIIHYIDSFSIPGEDDDTEAVVADSSGVLDENAYLAGIDTEKNEALGKALFEGDRSFKNGGASCISCHHVHVKEGVQGGLLAMDLTQSFSRSGGMAGIRGIIEFPPFPAMKDAYDHAPITEDESLQLQVFLMRADNTYALDDNPVSGFLKQGLIGMVVLLLVISMVWFKRKRRSVNYTVIQRQLR